MAKKVFQKIGDILLRPFTKHFPFFVAFFILGTSCYIIRQLVIDFNIIPAILTAMHCFNLSYIVTLLIGLINSKITQKTIKGLLIAFATVDFIFNFYCICYLKSFFDGDTALIMLETNLNEAKEFASVMLPKWIVFTEIGVFFSLLSFWWLSNKRNLNLGKKASLLAIVFIGICFAGNYYSWNVWKDGPIARFYEMHKYDVPSDLKSFFSHPKLTFESKQSQPNNVVLIIGESFARSHSSLYGYDKQTNPELKALKDSSLLFAFNDINSPASTTALSIRDMLSTFNQSDDNNKDKRWYEYVSLIELMKESGYDCYWFGNQACVNKNNGTARTFAQACDRQWFLQHDGIDETNDRYDFILVDTSYLYVNRLAHKHNLIIYHMLGSHFKYNMRYPNDFARFSEKDYLADPQSHREILSTYDNSILYNDYVVKTIMDMFKNTESIVIYLPDHGQVMYRNPNNPDYYAHGKGSSVNYALGVEIPFFVYASPLFQQKYPQIMERIKNRQENPKSWNSEDLPYFIMDLIGVKTINGEDVRPRSVLN